MKAMKRLTAAAVAAMELPPDQLDRIDGLIETLIALRDALDGDQDLEPGHHDGAALFPQHPLYDQTDLLATEAGPGDAADAEAEPDEDSDADEWSGIDLNLGLTRFPRWA